MVYLASLEISTTFQGRSAATKYITVTSEAPESIESTEVISKLKKEALYIINRIY